MYSQPQATSSAKPQNSHPFSKKLGIEGRGVNVPSRILYSLSAVASPYVELARESFPQLESVEQLVDKLSRMNAATFYRELVDWTLNNVNMFLVQTFVTLVALVWFVCPFDYAQIVQH